MKIISQAALCAVALTALVACQAEEPGLTSILPGHQVAVVDLPTIRPGRWLVRDLPPAGDDLSVLNSPATSAQLIRVNAALSDPDLEMICIEPGATVLRATQTDLSDCAQRSITRTGEGYLVEARCESGDVSSRVRATYSGDFKTVIHADLELSMAPKGQRMETMHVRIEGRYQGPCTGEES